MNDPIKRKKLYDSLKETGEVTVSFEDFTSGYSSPEKQQKLYDVLKNDGRVTVDFNTFSSGYFGDLSPKKLSAGADTESLSVSANGNSLSDSKENVTEITPKPTESNYLGDSGLSEKPKIDVPGFAMPEKNPETPYQSEKVAPRLNLQKDGDGFTTGTEALPETSGKDFQPLIDNRFTHDVGDSYNVDSDGISLKASGVSKSDVENVDRKINSPNGIESYNIAFKDGESVFEDKDAFAYELSAYGGNTEIDKTTLDYNRNWLTQKAKENLASSLTSSERKSDWLSRNSKVNLFTGQSELNQSIPLNDPEPMDVNGKDNVLGIGVRVLQEFHGDKLNGIDLNNLSYYLRLSGKEKEFQEKGVVGQGDAVNTEENAVDLLKGYTQWKNDSELHDAAILKSRADILSYKIQSGEYANEDDYTQDVELYNLTVGNINSHLTNIQSNEVQLAENIIPVFENYVKEQAEKKQDVSDYWEMKRKFDSGEWESSDVVSAVGFTASNVYNNVKDVVYNYIAGGSQLLYDNLKHVSIPYHLMNEEEKAQSDRVVDEFTDYIINGQEEMFNAITKDIEMFSPIEHYEYNGKNITLKDGLFFDESGKQIMVASPQNLIKTGENKEFDSLAILPDAATQITLMGLTVMSGNYSPYLVYNFKETKQEYLDAFPDATEFEASQYALLTNGVETLTERISPDKKLLGINAGNKLIDVLKGVSKESRWQATKSAGKEFLYNFFAEQGEELAVIPLQKGINFMSNLYNGDKKLQQEIESGELSETIIATATTFPFMGAGGTIAKYQEGRSSLTENDLLLSAVRNEGAYSKINEWVREAENNPDVPKESLNGFKNKLNDVIQFKDKIPANYSFAEFEKAKNFIQEKEALEQKKKELDPAFHEEINQQIQAVDEKIKNIKPKPEQKKKENWGRNASTNKRIESEEVSVEELQTPETVSSSESNTKETKPTVGIQLSEKTKSVIAKANESDVTIADVLEKESDKLNFYKSTYGESDVRTAEQESIVNELTAYKDGAIDSSVDNLELKLVNGKPEVTNKKGNNVSEKQKRKAVRESVQTGLYDGIPRALDNAPTLNSDEEVSNYVAENSENPIEVAEEINNIKSRKESNDVTFEDVLLPHIRKGIKEESFVGNSDKNNVTPKIRGSYFNKNGKSLDVIAQDVEIEMYGDYNANAPRITEQDIVDFILENPSITEYENAKKSNEQISLETKFTELTGLPATTQNIEAFSIDNQKENKNTKQNFTNFASNEKEDKISDRSSQAQQRSSNDSNSRIKEISDSIQRSAETITRKLKGQASSKHEVEDVQKVATLQFAKSNNIWIDDVSTLGTLTGVSGNENTISLDSDSGTVYKSNNLINSDLLITNLLDYLSSHNELFPETSYELVGFTGVDKGVNKTPYVEVVLKQDFVPNATQASLAEIENYMLSIGFDKVNDSTFQNEKFVVSDLHPRNVLKDENGTIYVIDNLITKKDSESSTDAFEYDFPFSVSADTKPFEDGNKESVTVEKLRTKYPDAFIVQSESDLPEPIQDGIRQQKAEGKIKGVFFRGRVFMVADNIKTMGQARGTYRHESLGHKGVIEYLGDKLAEFSTSIIDNAKGGRKRALIELAERYGLPTDLGSLTPVQKKLLGEEYIAKISENSDRYPQAWNEIVMFVRKALKEFGIKMQISDAEIRALINKVELKAKQNAKSQSQLNNDAKFQVDNSNLESEINEIISRAKAEGNFMFAPNGESTNLSEKQWVTVRTKNFKNWFGDWENDPENASKVVDANGEPLVVYHGTNNNFSEFKRSESVGTHNEPDQLEGIYFADNKEAAEWFTDTGNIVSAFLSIKKPYISERVKTLKEEQNSETAKGVSLKIENQGFDGVLLDVGFVAKGEHKLYLAFNPNQIKSATENVGTFNPNNNDIRFQKSSSKPPKKSISEVVRDRIFKARDLTLSIKDKENLNKQAKRKAEAIWKKANRGFNVMFRSGGGFPKEFSEIVKQLGRDQSAVLDRLSYESKQLKRVIAKATNGKTPAQFNEIGRWINAYMAGEDVDLSFMGQDALDQLDYFRARIDGVSNKIIDVLNKKMAYWDSQLSAVNNNDDLSKAVEDVLSNTRKAIETKQSEIITALIDAGYSNTSAISTASKIIAREKTAGLIKTIEDNKGKYINRSYEAFHNPKYLEDLSTEYEEMKPHIQKRYDHAVNYLINKEGYSKIDAKTEVNDYIRSLVKSEDVGDFIMSSTGRANAPFLKQRKELPLAFRELLGEIKDPTHNYIRTVFGMSEYLAKLDYQERMRDILLKTNVGSYRTEDANYTLFAGESPEWSILHNIRVPKEFMKTMNDMADLDPVKGWGARFYIQLTGWTKVGKTVWSPTTMFRNLYSGVALGINAGHFFGTHPKHTIEAYNQAFGTNKSVSTEQAKAFREKLVSLGVIGDGVNSGELRATLNDFRKPLEEMVRPSKLGRVVNFMNTAYAFGDDFYKVVGFLTERDRLIKSGMDTNLAEIKASERIRGGYPTYSYLPKGMKALRRFPLMATFVSFPYEAVRTTKNNMIYAYEDFRDGRPSMGMKRVAGLLVANVLNGGAVTLINSLLGWDDEDEKVVRKMLPEFQKNANLLFVRGKDGDPMFIDMTSLFPSEVWMKPLATLMGGRSDHETFMSQLGDASNELVAPYLSFDITTKTLFEIAYNKEINASTVFDLADQNVTGREIRALDKNSWENGWAIANHYLKKSGPGVYNNISEVLRSNNGLEAMVGEKKTVEGREYTNGDAVMAFFGIRATTLNHRNSLSYYGFKFKSTLTDIGSNARKEADKTTLRSDKTINSTVEEMSNDYKKLSKEAKEMIDVSRKLGLKDIEIFTILTGTSTVSKTDAKILLMGGDLLIKPIGDKTIERELLIRQELPSDKERSKIHQEIYLKNAIKINKKIGEVNKVIADRNAKLFNSAKP